MDLKVYRKRTKDDGTHITHQSLRLRNQVFVLFGFNFLICLIIRELNKRVMVPKYFTIFQESKSEGDTLINVYIKSFIGAIGIFSSNT